MTPEEFGRGLFILKFQPAPVLVKTVPESAYSHAEEIFSGS
jgi:hypothetical protein